MNTRNLIIPLLIAASAVSAGAQTVRDSVLTVTGPLKERQFESRNDFVKVEFAPDCGVTAIPDYAFNNCEKLREISIPKGVRKIGRGAFGWCAELRKVRLPGGLDDIGSQAFAYCARLADIGIPKSVRHIGANCFSFCKSLISISLPPALNELESYAFSECISLRRAVLPANSRMLGEMIFAGCSELESITVDSRTPPSFDCNSQPFDPEESYLYRRCVLKVPPGTERLYHSAPGWSLFPVILPL